MNVLPDQPGTSSAQAATDAPDPSPAQVLAIWAPTPVPRRRPMERLFPPEMMEDDPKASVEPGWIGGVLFLRFLGTPAGVTMLAGWAAGSFSLTTGILGAELFAAGTLTLLNGYIRYYGDEPQGDGLSEWLRIRLRPARGLLTHAEEAICALLAATCTAWWFNLWTRGMPWGVQAIFFFLIAIQVVQAIMRHGDQS